MAAVPLSQRFGMLPVMFWSCAFTLMFTLLCNTPGWIGFIVIRVLQGFFGTTAQVLGLTAIQEMYAACLLILPLVKV